MDGGRGFVETLQVKLTGEKLLSFLTVEEMKLLSLVSWDVMEVVRKSDEFSNRVELHLAKEALGYGDRNGLLRKGSFVGKHMLLEILSDIPDVLMEGAMEDLLEKVESLKVRLDLSKQQVETTKNKLNGTNAFQWLGSVLGRTRKLKTLEILGTIVELNKEGEPYFAPDKVIIEDLLNLHMHDRTGKRDEIDGPYCVSSEEYPKVMLLQREMSQTLSHLNLKQFTFRKQLKYSRPELIQSIPAILQACKGTLEVLELHTQVCCLAGMGNIELPKLKRLRLLEDVRVKPIQRSGVVAFISQQPALEELDMSVRAQLCCGILRALLGAGKLGKLKVLRIDAKRCVLDSDYDNLPMDWELLERMTQLKEFSLSTLMFSGELWYRNGEAILRRLPPAMEMITFEGTERFWGQEEGRLNPYNDSPSILISRFRNLTELNLHNVVYDGVTDEVLQSLITNCPKLRTLGFGRCPNVTKFGISGIRPTGNGEGVAVKTGASLDQLSGLLHLTIECCRSLQNKDVLQVVKLLGSLKRFQYSSTSNVSKKFLFDLVRSIPTLEELTLGSFIRCDEHDRADVCPRLLKFKEQAKARNPRLTVLELDEERPPNTF